MAMLYRCRYPRHMSDLAVCATQVRKQDGIHTVVFWSSKYIYFLYSSNRDHKNDATIFLVGRVRWRAPLQSELLEQS